MTNWNIEQILKHPLSVEELIKTLYVIEDLKDCKYPNDEILIGASAIIRDEICQMMGGHITDVSDYNY